MSKRLNRRPTGVTVEGAERDVARPTRIVSAREMNGLETITVGISDMQSFRDAIAHLREIVEGRRRLKQSQKWSQQGAKARRRSDTNDVRRFALDYRRRHPGSTFNEIASALLKARESEKAPLKAGESEKAPRELARLAKQVSRLLK